MSVMTATMAVFQSLASKPSRASAAAIGHKYVLNGRSPVMQIQAVNSLGDMVCDWSLTILDQTINDFSLRYLVRRHALNRVCGLLRQAVDQRYSRISKSEIQQLEDEAASLLEKHPGPGEPAGIEIEVVEELCDHLGQAMAEDVFEELPDF